MKRAAEFTPQKLEYLKLLAKQYPTVQQASTEIINLRAIQNLPKATEHFISDVHGEFEAFQHILNSASGVVREKPPTGISWPPSSTIPRRSWRRSSGRRRICGSGTASPSTASSTCAAW